MDRVEMMGRFYEAINKQIQYFIDEYTITYGDIYATFDEIKHELLHEARDKKD